MCGILPLSVQLIVSLCVAMATLYRDDVRRHIADLLTSSARPSFPPAFSSPQDPDRRRSRDVIDADLRQRRDVRGLEPAVNGHVRLYNHRRRQYVAMTPARYDVMMTSRSNDVMPALAKRLTRRRPSVDFINQISCRSCEFEMQLLCNEAPEFFRTCPLPPSLSASSDKSSTWIYGLVMFRSVTESPHYLCMDRRGRVVAKRLSVLSTKAEALSCTFYNALHDRRSNVLYNFRFPLSSARCRLAEWRRWQHSPQQRRHCPKWFLGSSRGVGSGDGVGVIRRRHATRGAMTVVDNRSIRRLRHVNKHRSSSVLLTSVAWRRHFFKSGRQVALPSYRVHN